MHAIIRRFLKAFFSLFFDVRYLSGKYFDDRYTGYAWCARALFQRNILRLAKPKPFPVGLMCHVSNAKNVIFDNDDINNFQAAGAYYQNFSAKIILGKGTYIAPNVGLITANHDVGNLDFHLDGKDIILGAGCWIGMNSVVLPGVELGPKTVVAAGAVVTKSFPEGGLILAGVPAKPIKAV